MKTVLLYGVLIAFTVCANLLLKTGATSAERLGHGMMGLINWRVVLGLACFASGAFVYANILRWYPLNVAQAFASAQFVAVILASWLVLSEPIGGVRWIGILFITAGILLVGVSR